jgi:hypothetical protein
LFRLSLLHFALSAILYLRFVYQHHWNIVADWVNAPAFDAFQSAAIGFQLDLRLAGGASEYVQQILIDWHRPEPHIAVSKLTKEPLARGIEKSKAYHKTVSSEQ